MSDNQIQIINGDVLTTDSSQISEYMKCPKKYYYKYIEQIRRPDYCDLDLRWGEALHVGLEQFDGTKESIENAVKAFHSRFLESADDVGHRYAKVKTRANGEAVLRQYVEFYANNFSNWKTIANEQIGQIHIGNIVYLVKIDKLIENNGCIYVVDYKSTASKKTQTYMDKFELSTQVSGYVAWAKQKYENCAGFIPVVMFCGYRERKYKDEPAGFHVRYDYTLVNRTKEQLEEFEKDVMRCYEEIMHSYKSGFWKKHPTACEYWGCEYAELCRSCDDECVKESLYQKYDATKYLNRET